MIPALGKSGQENQELKAIIGYVVSLWKPGLHETFSENKQQSDIFINVNILKKKMLFICCILQDKYYRNNILILKRIKQYHNNFSNLIDQCNENVPIGNSDTVFLRVICRQHTVSCCISEVTLLQIVVSVKSIYDIAFCYLTNDN